MSQRSRKKTSLAEKSSEVPVSSHPRGGILPQWSAPLLVAILCVLLYTNSVQNDFAFDDKPLIVRNKAIQSFRNIPAILGISDPDNFLVGLIGGVNYRPIRIVSFTIDYFFSGTSPIAYHIFNIMYHFLTAWVVFLLIKRLLASSAGWIAPPAEGKRRERESLAFWTALFTAILFTVHPIQTNVVTYISGRRDVLSTLFYLLGFLYFLKFREAQVRESQAEKGRNPTYFGAACFLFFILALLTKEMTVTLPLAFFMADFMREFPPHRAGREPMAMLRTAGRIICRHRRFYYPFLFIALLGGLYYMFFRGASNRVVTGWQWWGGSALNNFLTMSTVLVFYIKLMLFPVVLSADYSYNVYPVVQSLWEPRVLFSLAVLTILVVLIVRWIRRNRVLAFGWIWFFMTLLPVSQIIPHHELLAEHYLYLPSVGFCLLVAWALASRITDTGSKRWVAISSSAVLVLLVTLWSVRTIVRNADWRSDKVLWAKTVQTVPPSFRAQFNMGNLLRQDGSLYKALDYFNRALKIRPEDPRVLINLGAIYERMGLSDRAYEQYRRALLADPEYAAAHNNIGGFYLTRGEVEKAIHHFTKATDLLSNFIEARLNLAIAYGKKFYTEEALKQFHIATLMDPENARIYYYRGVFFDSIGEPELAKRDLHKALLLDPKYALPHLKLGEMYVAQKDPDAAAKEFHEVARLEPRITQAHVNLGNIYAEKGEVERAIIHFRNALDIDPNLAAAHKGMAIIYLTHLKDLEGAIFHFRRSIELDPKQEGADRIRAFLANPGLTPPEEIEPAAEGSG